MRQLANEPHKLGVFGGTVQPVSEIYLGKRGGLHRIYGIYRLNSAAPRGV